MATNKGDFIKYLLECAQSIDWIRLFACFAGVILAVLVFGLFVNMGIAIVILGYSWIWGIFLFLVLYYSGLLRKK